MEFLLPTDITFTTNINEVPADVLVVVGPEVPHFLIDQFERMRHSDSEFEKTLSVFYVDKLKMKVIYSPLFETTELHDVRIYHSAARRAFTRVVLSEFRNPILFIPRCTTYPNGDLITALGALHGVYLPLQIREQCPGEARLIQQLFLLVESDSKGKSFCQEIAMIESALSSYRDVAMADPERMTPILIEDYAYELFRDSPVVMETISDPDMLRKEFPLLDLVNRAAFRAGHRYSGRVVFLEYVPLCVPRKTLMMVGKGVSYDAWRGMSRDKAGAAAAIGFMMIAAVLKPMDIHIASGLALVRNSLGEPSHAPGEIIRSRAGRLVRVNISDREGRLVMADILAFMKDQVLLHNLPDPHLFTLATLTQHNRLLLGNGYPVIIDNSVAMNAGHALRMQNVGLNYAEPFGISVLSEDDIDSNSDPITHDLATSSHQTPVAFLMQTSGLCEHGAGSRYPIKYSHIDLHKTAFNYPYIPGSQPIITLAKVHLD